MTTIITLMIIGTILVFLETILIGGVWGVAGVCCFVYSTYLGFSIYGSLAGLGMLTLSIILSICAILTWVYVLPKTSIGKKFFLNSKLDGKSPTPNHNNLIGKKAIAITDCLPTGKISINQKTYDANAIISHIKKGDTVEIVSANSFELKIKKI